LYFTKVKVDQVDQVDHSQEWQIRRQNARHGAI
jgi:hypothetical protein